MDYPTRRGYVPVGAIESGLSKPSSSELLRAMESLDFDDPARALALLAIHEDDPALFAAIIRRLVSEIRSERI
jgi:hypothetical protein